MTLEMTFRIVNADKNEKRQIVTTSYFLLLTAS